ncbi:hypothetical protein BU25DRAFT_423462 [Macroventuria anomochaeta]|uniref:Uncharacterized protein n=1 Tax=Macroventuria anomochaeta TaxID=301207 RepID=A0ACB6RTL1_9PLEO|nr:uncharacterized protein BU25DRAFT_423462 [Macroventuria anomochaeta]KAF2625401.1 hypothetical protein BU25DRAFT_423462 [Macroventuria anomochaeta]
MEYSTKQQRRAVTKKDLQDLQASRPQLLPKQPPTRSEPANGFSVKYSTLANHEIKLKVILDIAEKCEITFWKGDILFLRTGFTKEWDTTVTAEAKKSYAENPAEMQHAGVEATQDVLRWVWDEGFTAVAGDSVAWEVFPPKPEPVLHECLLAGWGMPIGEMFDLEGLAELGRGELVDVLRDIQSIQHARGSIESAKLYGVVLRLYLLKQSVNIEMLPGYTIQELLFISFVLVLGSSRHLWLVAFHDAYPPGSGKPHQPYDLACSFSALQS